MSDYDNTNSGALFANTERKTDKHPNARGTLNVEGREYWISAWTKTSKKGEKYQSLSVQPKDGQTTRAPDAAPKPVEFDDDIPF
jgi:uncharacterized protein (DUF736 family)